MENKKSIDKNQLHLLSHGRHFRLDSRTKVIVGRSEKDNQNLIKYFNADKDILLKHSKMAGPDVILSGNLNPENIQTAAMICAGYTRSKPGESANIRVKQQQDESIIGVKTVKSSQFRPLMI